MIVQARDRDREKVLRRLADRNRQVTGLIEGYGEAVEKRESGPASVHPELKDKRAGERVAGYLGTASTTVTIRDFTILGELIVSVADGELITVDGPWWALRPGSPVCREARLAAAHDATARAREYAEAFGGSLGDLLEAADAGLLTGDARPQVFQGRAMSRGFARAESAPPEPDLKPARLAGCHKRRGANGADALIAARNRDTDAGNREVRARCNRAARRAERSRGLRRYRRRQ